MRYMKKIDSSLTSEGAYIARMGQSQNVKKKSPVRRDVAKKVVNILEDLGNSNFCLEDIKS
jgi:hypothetical protein